jgi:hypothetical protein
MSVDLMSDPYILDHSAAVFARRASSFARVALRAWHSLQSIPHTAVTCCAIGASYWFFASTPPNTTDSFRSRYALSERYPGEV